MPVQVNAAAALLQPTAVSERQKDVNAWPQSRQMDLNTR